MPAASRVLDRAARIAARHLADAGSTFRERRLELGLSQEHVAGACRMSRVRYSQIERAVTPTLSIAEFDRVAAVLGLSPSLRLFPGGPPVRDAGQSSRLVRFLRQASPPLSWRTEVPVASSSRLVDQRAWDAMLFGHTRRTGIELEMRMTDVQAMRRRHELKRRDDPTEQFLMLVADNRRVLAEFEELFADLPGLRPSAVRGALEGGEHPPTGILLI